MSQNLPSQSESSQSLSSPIFASVTPHGQIQKVFDDVFFIQGSVIMAPGFQVSRNMIIVREGRDLTLISSVRLDEAGLKALDELGQVKHLVKLGNYHLGIHNGLDDAFYLDRYQAKLWAMSGMTHKNNLVTDIELLEGGNLPFSKAKFIAIPSSKMPEGVILIEQNQGVLITADSLQNWIADAYFSDIALVKMQKMGFIRPANIGPEWRRVCEPTIADFERIFIEDFECLVPSHGVPIQSGAKKAFLKTLEEVYSHT